MNIVHEFHESPVVSEAVANEPWWENIYRKVFPYFESMEIVASGTPEQLAGIDRMIRLEGGGVINIDEKVRHTDYDDILLELWSSVERETMGWEAAPLRLSRVCLPAKQTVLHFSVPATSTGVVEALG